MGSEGKGIRVQDYEILTASTDESLALLNNCTDGLLLFQCFPLMPYGQGRCHCFYNLATGEIALKLLNLIYGS